MAMDEPRASNGQRELVPQDPTLKDSLHGASAAKRQAITELLFFSSVGDLHRCRKIISAWSLQVTDAKTADYDRRTPLHLAAAEGCYSVVQWLLQQKADVNPVDRFWHTPLEDAVRGDHGEVAQLLIENGGKVCSRETKELIELSDSPLAGNVRLFIGYDPEWEIDPSAMTLLEKIGEGEFGVVHKARWLGTIVAVKVLKHMTEAALGDFRTELNVLQKVHHPHTVQFLGAVTKQHPFMIVTEYMSGGSLLDLFSSKLNYCTWRAVQLALDCARGLAYLHNRNPQAVIHRDLKPANIMLGGPKVFSQVHKHLLLDQIGVLKIADFGLSKSLKLARPKRNAGRQSLDNSTSKLSKDSYSIHGGEHTTGGSEEHLPVATSSASNMPTTSYKLTGETGSYRYMAPEVFRHEPYNNKVDVYSFAMICFQLFEGWAPFCTLDPVQAARGAAMHHSRPTWGERNRFGKDVPLALRKLVEACWSPSPDDRPEFEDIVLELENILRDVPPPNFAQGAGASTQPGGCCAVQ